MTAGKLRNLVILQPPAFARGPDGSEIKVYPPDGVAKVRAEIVFGTGREFFAAKQVDADLTHMVTIRYYAGLDTGWRVKFNDPLDGTTRYFDVRSVKPLGALRRYQLLQCRELVGLEPQT